MEIFNETIQILTQTIFWGIITGFCVGIVLKITKF